MKTILSIFSVCMILFLSVNTADAQKFGVAAGLGYGTEFETGSLNAGILYSINDDIRSSVDFFYFFPKNDVTWMELNANGHYGFIENEKMFFYGLAGVNYIIVSIKGAGTAISNSNETGFNVGVGLDYQLGGIGVYAETKYVINKIMLNNQIMANAGVRFFF